MEEMKKQLLDEKKDEPDVYPDNFCGRYMRFIWELMEKSETSFAAKCVNFISLSLLRPKYNFCLVSIVSIYNFRYPKIKEEVTNILPVPDLSNFEEQFTSLKKNIFRAMPTSRLTDSRSDASVYNR